MPFLPLSLDISGGGEGGRKTAVRNEDDTNVIIRKKGFFYQSVTMERKQEGMQQVVAYQASKNVLFLPEKNYK